MFDLTGRVAVVTGASAGLGRGEAIALARQGADVAILARRMDKLEEVAEEIRSFGHKCLPVQCDVTVPEQIDSAVKNVIDEFGKVDILVNNTGGGPGSPIEDMSDEIFMHHVNLELLATFRFTRGFGKYMLEQGYGRVINIASILGLGGIGQDGEAKCIGYESCKGAILNFTRGVAVEWAKRGVTVNSICPGFFESQAVSGERVNFLLPMVERKTPMGRIGKGCTDIQHGGELDSAIIFLAAEESSYVTGANICVDGGWSCY
ncbi:MAG: SDR family oxidoreductase [Candidatus Limivicinus sp.]|nr:SDR family oxidoreductase [Candidatus Limivicinus sp.]